MVLWEKQKIDKIGPSNYLIRVRYHYDEKIPQFDGTKAYVSVNHKKNEFEIYTKNYMKDNFGTLNIKNAAKFSFQIQIPMRILNLFNEIPKFVKIAKIRLWYKKNYIKESCRLAKRDLIGQKPIHLVKNKTKNHVLSLKFVEKIK